MDMIQIIINSSSKLSLADISSLIKDIVTILGIIIGLWFGKRGVNKYLIQDIIKAKVNKIQEANSVVFEKTNEIINHIRKDIDTKNVNRIINKKEIAKLTTIANELLIASGGCSSEITTLSFFLYETIKNIEPQIIIKSINNDTGKKEFKYGENRTASDFYHLVFSTVKKINYLAGVIVDIPNKADTEEYHDINNEIRKYLNKSGYSKIKGFNFGLDLDPNSSISLVYYNLIKRNTHSYIFNKKYFDIFQNNIPICYDLLVNKIYLPISVSHTPMHPILGDYNLHLIDFRIKNTFDNSNESYETVEFVYTNLSSFFRFKDPLTLDKVLKEFKDSFLERDFKIETKNVLNFFTLAEDSLKIICKKEFVEDYFTSVEDIFIEKLKRLKS